MTDDGIRILTLRRRAGLKQWELAARLGITATRLSQFETGKRDAPAELLAKIDELLGASGVN